MKIRIKRRGQAIIVLVVISLFVSACAPAVTDVVPLPVTVTPSTVTETLEVYFTDPSSPHARDYEGGPAGTLAAAIDNALLSVDVAAYSLNLWSIRDALIHASQRGVLVRMVMESDNMQEPEVQDLLQAGIPVIGDRQESLMHDKFVIIDRTEVWTGSMNFTVAGAYRDNNNLVFVRSGQVAEDYLSEFEEMFTEDRFGAYSLFNTSSPELTVNRIPVEVYFSPEDGVAERLLELIGQAEESIYFMAFSLTSNDIGPAMLERAQAGITLSGVMDADQVDYGRGSEYDSFLQAGLDVRLDGNDALMHHKVIVIDRQIVVTGSYNFTASAEESNDENVVIIFDPKIAAAYLDEFQRIYDQAQVP